MTKRFGIFVTLVALALLMIGWYVGLLTGTAIAAHNSVPHMTQASDVVVDVVSKVVDIADVGTGVVASTRYLVKPTGTYFVDAPGVKSGECPKHLRILSDSEGKTIAVSPIDLEK